MRLRCNRRGVLPALGGRVSVLTPAFRAALQPEDTWYPSSRGRISLCRRSWSADADPDGSLCLRMSGAGSIFDAISGAPPC
jgi:hypothetical protein